MNLKHEQYSTDRQNTNICRGEYRHKIERICETERDDGHHFQYVHNNNNHRI